LTPDKEKPACWRAFFVASRYLGFVAPRQAAVEALALTPLRRAIVFSLELATFSSLRFVLREKSHRQFS
jgi:hypothetical protein